VLACAGAIGGGHVWSQPPQASRAASPVSDAAVESETPSSGSAARSAQPQPQPQPKVKAAPAKPKISQQRLLTWFANVRDYHEKDRAAVLDAGIGELVAAGPESVFKLEQYLAGISVYAHEERAGAFHVLARIGEELVRSKDPEARRALEAIQRVAKAELELPSFLEPDPAIDVEALPAPARERLLHDGVLVEKDGALWQPTALNKLPVVRMLRTLAGAESRKQLERLAAVEDNSPGVKFAVEQALELARK